MRRLVPVILMMISLLPSVARSSDTPVVIELFTSQGCSSCPPADQFLAQLADEEDIIALSLHVDYWDYIGWQDEFALPQFTKRQKLYARAMGERMIYTPQVVVNGANHVVGSDTGTIRSLIGAYSEYASPVDLKVERHDDMVAISATSKGQPLAEMDVHIVQYLPEKVVEITKGENAGKTILYRNIVQVWTNAGRWTGQGSLKMEAPARNDLPVAVLLQHSGFGPIYAAVNLD